MSLRFAELPPVIAAVDSSGEKHEYPDVLCPDCGAPTKARADGSVLCSQCVQQADWRGPLEAHVARYPKILSFARCSQCERVQIGTNSWESKMDHESSALLGLLLNKIKRVLLGKRALSSIDGMSRALNTGRLSLEDARLVYTEPHSLRVHVEVVVKHEAAIARSLPTTSHKCQLEFIEERKLCPQCTGDASRKMGKSGKDDFAAKVQVRVRRADGGNGGERTLRSLEDGLRLTSASVTAKSARIVSRTHSGFDVDFGHRQDAQKFLGELRRLGRAPLKFADETRKLLTHDAYSNTSDFQRTTLVWVPPIDKSDLIISNFHDTHTQKQHMFALVLSVRTSLRLADIANAREFNLSADAFFHNPLDPILSAKHFVHFHILSDGKHCIRTPHHASPSSGEVENIEHNQQKPRSFYSPFSCKPGLSYRGYDLDTIAHRVHIPANVPRVVIVLPLDAKAAAAAPQFSLPEGKSAAGPAVHDDEMTKGTSASSNKILSRKDRRRQAKKEKAAANTHHHQQQTVLPTATPQEAKEASSSSSSSSLTSKSIEDEDIVVSDY